MLAKKECPHTMSPYSVSHSEAMGPPQALSGFLFKPFTEIWTFAKHWNVFIRTNTSQIFPMLSFYTRLNLQKLIRGIFNADYIMYWLPKLIDERLKFCMVKTGSRLPIGIGDHRSFYRCISHMFATTHLAPPPQISITQVANTHSLNN
jgi:hypothetical protein